MVIRPTYCMVVALACIGIGAAVAQADLITDSTADVSGVFRSSDTDYFGVKETDTTLVGLGTFSPADITASTVPNGTVIGRDLNGSRSWDYEIVTTVAEAFLADSILFTGTGTGQANRSDVDRLTVELFINGSAIASDTVVFAPTEIGTLSPFTVTTPGNDNNSGTKTGPDFTTQGIDFTLSLTAEQVAALIGTPVTSARITVSSDSFSGGVEEFALAGTLQGITIPEPASMVVLGLGALGVLIRRRA